VVAPVAGTDHALVGPAVGYLLSAHLREDALEDTVATEAAHLLVGPLGTRAAPQLIERAAVKRVRELEPWQRTLQPDEWTELCELSCILARFEQYFRAGASVLGYLAPTLTEKGHDLRSLAHALVNTPTLHDLDALGRATVADHASIRNARELFIDPTFAQSLALGGADADVIYDARCWISSPAPRAASSSATRRGSCSATCSPTPTTPTTLSGSGSRPCAAAARSSGQLRS
jgi:hypothetical protein